MKRSTKITALILAAIVGAGAAYASTTLKELPEGAMTQSELDEIALGYVDGEIIHFKIEKDDGITVIEYEIQSGQSRTDIELDVMTGELIELDKDND